MTQLGDNYEEISRFVGEGKVLIVDPSQVTRSSVAQILSGMGLKGTSLVTCATFDEAEERVRSLRPKVVLADYELDQRKCSLELFQTLKGQIQDLRAHLFVLVTGNTSQTAVARAAEEDVDSYILKPFTPASFRNALMRAVITKLNPSTYLQTIETGKTLLSRGKLEEAIAVFEQAVAMDPEPSLAFSYLGQVHLIRQALHSAQGDFLKGLQFNKLHYKCMVGLFEVLMFQKEHVHAYEVIKRIAQFYPANPSRMTALLRLTILTGHYEDMGLYYTIFTNLGERTDEMTKVMCSALIVAGRHHATHGDAVRALDCFQKAAVSSAGRPRILKDLTVAMVEAGLPLEADKTLTRFPGDTRDRPEFLVAHLAVANALEDPESVLDKAQRLLAQGLTDPTLYKVAIRRAKELNKLDLARDWEEALARQIADGSGSPS